MASTNDSTSCELSNLKAIAEELHRLADEATERYRAALARAEGTPLLDHANKAAS